MFPLVGKISELVNPWGVKVLAETAAEAQTVAAFNDTDWGGYNHAGEYVDEEDDENYLVALDKDYKNGHLMRKTAK